MGKEPATPSYRVDYPTWQKVRPLYMEDRVARDINYIIETANSSMWARDEYKEPRDLEAYYSTLNTQSKQAFWQIAKGVVQHQQPGWWSFLFIATKNPTPEFCQFLQSEFDPEKWSKYQDTGVSMALESRNRCGDKTAGFLSEQFLTKREIYEVGMDFIESLIYSNKSLFLKAYLRHWEFYYTLKDRFPSYEFEFEGKFFCKIATADPALAGAVLKYFEARNKAVLDLLSRSVRLYWEKRDHDITYTSEAVAIISKLLETKSQG